MINQEIIDRGGSKLEITRSVLEKELDIPVPNSSWKYYGESRDKLISDFNKMKKPVIVRGSHKNDNHGFIDVVPTVKYVRSVSDLEEAIDEIEFVVASEDVKRHSKDWEQSYTPEVHILMQEQSGPIAGSMIRHPHDKDQLRIQYRDRGDEATPVSSSFVFGKDHFYNDSWLGISDKKINELIEMYEKLENSGILDNNWSYQIEFGLNPLFFYQARPFKKFEKAGDFKIPRRLDSDFPYIHGNDSFGVTSEKGLNLPFVFAESVDVASINPSLFDKEEPYALSLFDRLTDTPSIENNFGNLKFFDSRAQGHNSLFHGNYRLMKKADFSLIAPYISNVDNMSREEIAKEFETSRFFSNGLEGIVVPEKYL
ncbi:hypothetical protein HOD29_04620 [archaeon]|jgi:hypothetical protein|nr:hypothetical protein [archaeon]